MASVLILVPYNLILGGISSPCCLWKCYVCLMKLSFLNSLWTI